MIAIKSFLILALSLSGCFLAACSAQGECARVLEAAAAGSYHRPIYYYQTYVAGHSAFGEARNYFIFNVPEFTAPLVSAELRVPAGTVTTTTPSVPFELHSVEAPPASLVLHSPYEMIFDDLGDGTLLGRRDILSVEGRKVVFSDSGALIQIPLNVDGLNELRTKQGDQIAFGGNVPPPATNVSVFIQNTLYSQPPQLVLYFSNSRPAEIRAAEPTRSGEVLATDRVNLAATVCGKTPLVRQWFRDGEAVPNGTNDVLEIRSMTEADAGSYQLLAANEFGIEARHLADLTFAPLRISFGPYTLERFVGEALTLYATVESRLPVTYQWRKNGTALFGETQGQIALRNLAVADSGGYDVVVSNSSGSRTSAVTSLTVKLRPPGFVNDEPEMWTLAVGSRIELYDFAYGSPPLQFQWYRDGQEVPGANSNFLVIASIGFNDAGSYWLVAANPAGTATSDVFQVTVEPLVIYNAFDHTALWLNDFSFYTFVDSFVPVAVQWYFNGEPVPDGTNATLSFAAVDFTNAGPYFLTASNAYGMKTSSVFTLSVITQEPTAYVSPYNWRAWVGEDVTFQGYTSGGPPPALQWFFKNMPIPGATGRVLELKGVTTNQTGTYTLLASNSSGTASGSAFLTVLAEAPFFLNLPMNSNVVAGSIVTLRAKAVAGPPPTYQWRKDGVDLPGQTNTTLSLGAVDAVDAGTYEVVARNEFGEARYVHSLRLRPATGLDRWTWRLPQAQGSRLYNVAWGDGRYVAVGKSGNIITSSDSRDWTSVIIEADTDLSALAFGNGVFVTAGLIYDPLILTNLNRFPYYDYDRFRLSDDFGLVLVSSNGLKWEAGSNPDSDQLRQIVFGNGVFAGIGYNGRDFCYTSIDGRTWTGQALSGLRGFEIVFGNGRFVAYASDGYLYYSTDGREWTSSGVSLYSPRFTNGRFIARGDVVYESVNGVDWAPIGPASQFIYPQQFAGAGGVYVGGAETPGYVAYSTDAAQWIPVDTGTRQEIEWVIFANGQFLGVGEAGTITRSVDGRTWTPDEVANKVDFYGITHGAGLHVAAGDAGAILTSSNGTDWVRRNTPTTRNLHAVTYADGLFVAGGRGGTVITSPDGLAWTARVSGIDQYIERIAHGDGLWVAVAERGAISTSSDGVNWNARSTGQPFTDHEGIAYGNGAWVAAGGYFLDPVRESQAVGTIYASTNGLAWTRLGPNPEKRWRDVTFGRGKFVVVGNDGVLAFSTNGIHWSIPKSIANQNLRRVHYANGRFVAVGNDGTLISSADPANGRPWTRHRSRNSQNLHDIVAAPDGTFVFVGNNGMLLQSGDTQPRILAVGRDGRLEFDRGIAENLRLERSTNLRTWATEAVNVTSPFVSPVTGAHSFWRLAGE